VEPRSNEVPRDWENVKLQRGFVYRGLFSMHFTILTWFEEYLSLYGFVILGFVISYYIMRF